MRTIEIRKDIKLEVDELLQGLSDMDLDSLEKFSEALSHIIARRKSPKPSEKELALLDRIYQGFPIEAQHRYDDLYKKLQNETILPEEHKELTGLVEQTEEHNAEWLKAIAELVRLVRNSTAYFTLGRPGFTGFLRLVISETLH